MSISTLPEGEGNFEDQLRAFDVSWADLGGGVLMRAHNMARPYDSPLFPPTGTGFVRWLHMVGFLHELFLPRGWEPCEFGRMQGKLIHRETRRAIVVMSGDKNTGTTRMPRSRYDCGIQTRQAVEINVQEVLPGMPEDVVAAPVDLDEYETWFLLNYVTRRCIQSELSMAVGVDETGHADMFKPRIRFPFLKIDGTPLDMLDDERGDDDGGDSIVVPVQPL